MDELFCPTSSPPSFFSVDGLEFESCEILEKWLGGDDDGLVVDKHPDGAAGNDETPAPAAAKRRGRKPVSRAISHVEAERQRREKLNRRFCDLRAAVPTVSRMDRASLLADATSYIADLRGRVDKLEAKVAAPPATASAAVASPWLGLDGEKLEVRMFGRDAAALRLTSAARHAPARLMDALRQLDLPVQHASVCRAGGVTVQDAVVDVPAGLLQDEAWLRAALLRRMQGSRGGWNFFPNN